MCKECPTFILLKSCFSFIFEYENFPILGSGKIDVISLKKDLEEKSRRKSLDDILKMDFFTKPVEEKKKFHITSILGFAFSLAAPFGLAILVISQSLPEQLYVLFGLFGLAIACGLTVAGFVLSIIGIKKSTNRIFGILGTVFGGLNVVIGSYYAVICCIALWFAFAALFTIATL